MRRKLLMLLGAFLVIYLINFTIPRLMPGDPFDYVSSAAGDDGSVAYSEEQKEQLRAYYGLDKPFWEQLGTPCGATSAGTLARASTTAGQWGRCCWSACPGACGSWAAPWR